MSYMNLGNRSISGKDPRPETFLDTEWIDQTFAGRAEVYHNIWLDGKLFLKVAIVSPWGLAAVIPYRERADVADGMAVRGILGVDASCSRIIYHSEEISLVLSDDGRTLTAISDIYGYLRRFLNETENGTKRRMDSVCVSRLMDKFEALENGERPVKEGDELIDSDGNLYVRRNDPVMLGPIDLGLVGKRSWYPVSDDNTDRLVTMAAFGGWFGLHCFAEGEIAEGLLYLLSCGCAGILPAMDIVQYICGTKMIRSVEYVEDEGLKRVRTTLYLRKPKNKPWSVICVFIAIVTALAAWQFLYQWALPAILRDLYLIVTSKGGDLSWLLGSGWK